MKGHNLYPLFLSVEGRRCVVVGGGKIAFRKARDLIERNACVEVVAEKVVPELIQYAEARDNIAVKTKRYEENDLDGALLVFAATDDNDINIKVADDAHKRHAIVNVVDTPEYCDFYAGAVVKRGAFQLAISTGGCCPSFARSLRENLEREYPEEYADYIQFAGEMRSYILEMDGLQNGVKKDALNWIGSREARTLFFESGKEVTWKTLKNRIIST